MSKDQKTSSVMRQIDENLRRVYFDTEDDEIPERFQQLLRRLKEKDEGRRND